MRPFQIFASMKPDRAVRFFNRINEESPVMFQQAVHAAAAAMKARPAYLRKQPFEKRSDAVRRALSRFGSDAIAEEMLAVFFLECRKELLLEWLDLVGVEHEDGALKEESPGEPDAAHLGSCVETFRAVEEDEDRELLLQAFAAQSAIDWPALDSLVEVDA